MNVCNFFDILHKAQPLWAAWWLNGLTVLIISPIGVLLCGNPLWLAGFPLEENTGGWIYWGPQMPQVQCMPIALGNSIANLEGDLHQCFWVPVHTFP